MKTKNKIFLISLFLTVVLFIAICLSLNIFFDPLWYFNGNIIGKKNFAFNERMTKTNQFLKRSNKFDCLIFGSSRSTLLHENLIQNYNCFNYSFSGGNIYEFNKFGEYVKQKISNPKIIIIGVDGFNFGSIINDKNTPDFILKKLKTPQFYKSYLSLDSVLFSFRLLMNYSPMPRYYDQNFLCNILPNAPVYRPSLKMNDYLFDLENEDLINLLNNELLDKRHLRLSTIDSFLRLKDLFKNSKCIGYVPPISPYKIVSWNKEKLSTYLDSIHRISRVISPFYDFSIPSSITANTLNTYDGSHYNVKTNSLIADIINNESKAFGIRVDTLDKKEYFQAFITSLIEFINTQETQN